MSCDSGKTAEGRRTVAQTSPPVAVSGSVLPCVHLQGVGQQGDGCASCPAHRRRTVGGILRTPEGKIDYTQDFFEKASYLTVSGQLNAEYYACALSNVYTFGPTFRSAVNKFISRMG